MTLQTRTCSSCGKTFGVGSPPGDRCASCRHIRDREIGIVLIIVGAIAATLGAVFATTSGDQGWFWAFLFGIMAAVAGVVKIDKAH